MNLDISTFYQHGLINLHGQGELTLASLVNAMEQAARMEKRNEPTRFLYDLRNMTIDESVFDLFDSAQLLGLAWLTPRDRIAIVCSAQDTQFLRMEDSAVRNGYQMRVFTDKTAAVSWLRSGYSARALAGDELRCASGAT